MAKEDGELSDLRREYKTIKKELNKHDSFIDSHPLICIFGPFFLSLCITVVAAVTSSDLVGLVALPLFITSMATLGIFITRSNRITRINAKLDDIEHEVKLFHSSSAIY
jgi:hypothetical protein